MAFEQQLKKILESMSPQLSDWKFVTSGGGELTVGTPIVHVGVNAAGGVLYVQKGDSGPEVSLKYGGLGGSLGASLIPFPANFNFSIPAMPSAGRVYKMPAAGRSLVLDDFKGVFVMLEVSGDVGPGAAGCLFFTGCNALMAGLAGAMTVGAAQIPMLIATSKGCTAIGGMCAALLPVNASISAIVGVIL